LIEPNLPSLVREWKRREVDKKNNSRVLEWLAKYNIKDHE
jgi:hypothetical protein